MKVLRRAHDHEDNNLTAMGAPEYGDNDNLVKRCGHLGGSGEGLGDGGNEGEHPVT